RAPGGEGTRPRNRDAGRQRALGPGAALLLRHAGRQGRARRRARSAGAHVGRPEDPCPAAAPMTPPRFPRAILRAIVPFEDRAAIIGDLDEEFGTRTASSAGTATRWY